MKSGRPRKGRRKAERDYRKPLLEREHQFVDFYVVNPNARDAAAKAGYSAKYGQQLLNKPNVAAAIRRRMQDATEKADIEAKDVLLEFSRLAFANMADFVEEYPVTGLPRFRKLSDIPRKHMAAISEMVVEEVTEGRGEAAEHIRRVRFKLHDKVTPLVKLGQYLKMFQETNGNGNGHTTINQTVVIQNALSAADGIIERILAGSALEGDARPVPDGPVLPVEVRASEA